MKKFLFVLLLLHATNAYADVTRTITIMPFNFANNTSQPESIEQIRAKFEAFGAFLDNTTNGMFHLIVVVNPYVTVSDNLDLSINPNTGIAVTCTSNNWYDIVIGLDTALGYPLTGDRWLYSPLTFGACSERDGPLFMMDGRNFPFLYAIQMGISIFSPAPTVICRDALNNYVPFSNNCSFSQRTFQSMTGQGNGGLTCAERTLLGMMPAINKKVIGITDSLPQTVTITPIEQIPGTNEIQCLTINAFNVPGSVNGFVFDNPNNVPSITFELHKGTQWSGDWQTNGLSGHSTGTSNLYDFTPDGRVVPAGQGGTSTIAFGQSYSYGGTKVSVGNLKANGTVDVVLTADTNTPSPPDCPITPDGISGITLVVQESICATYTIGSNNYVLRNGINTGFNTGTYYVACNGVGYRYVDEIDIYNPQLPPKRWAWRLSANPTSATIPNGCVSAPPPTWTFVNGTIEKSSDNINYRLCIINQPCIIVKQ